MRTHTMLLRSLAWLATASAVVALGACEDQALNPPPAGPTTDTLFTSYVALGNSLTAGYQSGGINDSTQQQSYAVLLAKQMGTPFNVPLLTSPGCPPPIVNVFTQTRVGGKSGGDCYARTPGSVSAVINNVAVPGAAVVDLFNNFDSTSAWPSSPNPLTTFILGGRTQVQAAAAAHPTFVTVWIGNNDVLGALLSSTNPGDSNLVTPPDTFAARYTKLMQDLDAFGDQCIPAGCTNGTLKGGVLIGVVQVAVAPYLTQGRAWKAFEAQFDAQTSPLNALDVKTNCLDSLVLGAGDTVRVEVPFPVGGAVLAEAQAKIDSVQSGTLNPASLQPAMLDCSLPSAVSVPEVVHIVSAVTQYNAVIQAAAAQRGWAYLDPTPLLAQLAADPTAIRPFPAFAEPDSATRVNAPFGTALSRDGIHPSASSHKLIANALIQLINQKYGTNLQPVP